MNLLWVVVILAVVGVGIIAATGHFTPLAEQVDERPSLDLDFPITATQLRVIDFERVLRGDQCQSVDESVKHLANLLENGTLTTKDLDEPRFEIVANGYWPSQVDSVLEQLRPQCIDQPNPELPNAENTPGVGVNAQLGQTEMQAKTDIVS